MVLQIKSAARCRRDARQRANALADGQRQARCFPGVRRSSGRSRRLTRSCSPTRSGRWLKRPRCITLLAISRWPSPRFVENLGVIHWKERDYPQAEQRFRQAEELSLAPTNNARGPDRETTITLAQVNVYPVGLLWETSKHDRAIARATAAIQALEPYLRIEPDDQVARDFLPRAFWKSVAFLGALGKNRQAAQDWAKVIDLAPEPVTPHYRITLGLKLLKIGELDRAVSQVVLARQARRGSGEDLYDLACFYSRAAASVRRDEPSRLFETYVAEGLAALRRAADGGVFRDAAMRETAQKDSDLEILRGREEFRRIVRSQ